MLQENLVCLRNCHSYSQEYVAEKVGVTRQAYAKWEKGDSVPDIAKCAVLAKLYGTTLDMLFNNESEQSGVHVVLPPAPKGKHIFGTVTLNDKGQIVIPKRARDLFDFNTGDGLLILGDEDSGGIALMKSSVFEKQLIETLDKVRAKTLETEN